MARNSTVFVHIPSAAGSPVSVYRPRNPPLPWTQDNEVTHPYPHPDESAHRSFYSGELSTRFSQSDESTHRSFYSTELSPRVSQSDESTHRSFYSAELSPRISQSDESTRRSFYSSEHWSRSSHTDVAPRLPQVSEVVRRFSEPAVEDALALGERLRKVREVYDEVIKSLKDTLKKDELAEIFSESGNTAEDLCKVALDIKKLQGVADQRKMNRFVQAVDHYQGVFDVLAQADFSPLPLLWGGMKFFLIMSKNHCTLMPKVADMMSDIGISLERVQLYCHLHPTARMFAIADSLYISIIKFLEEVIVYYKKKSFRRYMSSHWQSFDIMFGHLSDQIQKIELQIQAEERAHAAAHARSAYYEMTQRLSLIAQAVDAPALRAHSAASFRGMQAADDNGLFKMINRLLFKGFKVDGNYHAELTATYKITASDEWATWFNVEQGILRRNTSSRLALTQAECDAPDTQYAVQWIMQERSKKLETPAVFIVWTKGMTAQAALASLLYQMIEQRPEVIELTSLSTSTFSMANTSIAALWGQFLQTAHALGGCRIYISIGSVGPEELALVGKFVYLAKKGDGPPLDITILHPHHEQFARSKRVVDLDAIDATLVNPWLHTTDALYHVLLMEMNIHENPSDHMKTLLWETAWREMRFTVPAVAVEAVVDELRRITAELSQGLEDEGRAPARQCEWWVNGVEKWVADPKTPNFMREIVQAHLQIIDLGLPAPTKEDLTNRLKLIVFSNNLDEVKSPYLAVSQRQAIWDEVQKAIQPGTLRMFGGGLKQLMGEMLEGYLADLPGSEQTAESKVAELGNSKFSRDGNWSISFLSRKELILDGIAKALVIGFEGTADALASSIR